MDLRLVELVVQVIPHLHLQVVVEDEVVEDEVVEVAVGGDRSVK